MFSNPKRVRSQFTDKERWFDYYAGYSPAFVRDVIQRTCGTGGHVLDPWNGSGTTTATAREMGATSTGIDINPVMVVVAKAKLVTVGLSSSLMPIADDLVSKAARVARPMDDDPLHEWFVPASAGAVRSLAEAVCELLTPLGTSANLYAGGTADHLSDLAAFFLVAVFRTTRSFISRFRASNPTWIKSPLTPQNRVRPPRQGVLAEFRRQVEEMAAGVGPPGGRQVAATIATGSAERLPLADASVDAVVASPPYCTRIDYAVATKPELAVLGCPLGGQFESLRRRLTGGPVVAPSALTPATGWGAGCVRFLEAVRRHPSKGSENYYHKLFVQYYGSMHGSLAEIGRVLEPGGHCVLVVQDSYYKDIHLDLAGHLTDMAAVLGWGLGGRSDFKATQVMARMNPKVQKYRTCTPATESVLWFRAASRRSSHAARPR